MASGARVKGTRLGAEFGWEDYQARNPDALVLVVVRDGHPQIVGAADPPVPRSGDVVVALTGPPAGSGG